MFGKNDAVVIESKLGSGGIGAVYKAWHTRLNKYVVVKELRNSAANDACIRRNEVEALKNVKNAHLPQVIDYFSDRDCSYTVMEFVEGESFDKLLSPGRGFPSSQVAKWYGQLASALEAIHGQDVCHRDIKPANVMLAPGGDVCLIDFNAALVRGTGSLLISRSPGYASPEQDRLFRYFAGSGGAKISKDCQCVGEPGAGSEGTVLLESGSEGTVLLESGSEGRVLLEAGSETELLPPQSIDWKRSDIYGLGATMYHILTGKRPPERALEAASVLRDGRYDRGLADIIERSMRMDPAERYASAALLSQAVKNKPPPVSPLN